jgi:predicted O-methyltransferase YrrM
MKTWTATGAGVAVAALAALLLASTGGAQDPGPRPGGRGPGSSSVSPVPAAPQAKSEEEKKILDVLLDLDKGQRRGMMNVPMEDGRMIRLLVENSGAKHVVEIGTSNGFSGLWICMGLKATGGKLTTHEIDAQRATLARENFKKAGVDSIVTLVEGDAHKEVGKLEGPVDMLFLDADKEGYMDYLKQLLPKVRPGGLILAHNVTSHGGDMKAYLDAVTTDPALETLYVNRHMSGMSVTLKKR